MNKYRSKLQYINNENKLGDILPYSTTEQLHSPKIAPQSLKYPVNDVSRAQSLDLINRKKQRTINSIQEIRKSSSPPQIHMHDSTIVLVGDSKCGKSSLVLSYLNKTFSTPSESILFETYEELVPVNPYNSVKFHIWDFPGDDYFDRFRPLGYANAKCILICFTLDDIDTLNHIRERWIPELETHCPNTDKFIIGIGSEIRFDKTKVNKAPKYDYCYKFARNLGCKYSECSLIDQKSCNEIFKKAALYSIGEFDVSTQLKVNKTRANTMECGQPQLQQVNRSPIQIVRKTSFKRRKAYCIVM